MSALESSCEVDTTIDFIVFGPKAIAGETTEAEIVAAQLRRGANLIEDAQKFFPTEVEFAGYRKSDGQLNVRLRKAVR